MKTLEEYIIESSLIAEQNEKIFPQGDASAKFVLFGGDHYRERKKERNVSDKEVIDMIFSAWGEIKTLFDNDKIHIWKKDKPGTNVIIADCRKNQNNPTCAVILVSYSRGKNKLAHPTFVVKTVFKKNDDDAADFAVLMHKERKGRDEQVIYLY